MHPRQSLANAIFAADSARAEVQSLGVSLAYIVRTPEQRAAVAELEAAEAAFNAADCGVSAARAELDKVPAGPLYFSRRAAA